MHKPERCPGRWRPRVNPSYLLALTVTAGLALWLWSGRAPSRDTPVQAAAAPVTAPLMQVAVRDQQARPIQRAIVLQGETAPDRKVTVRAETAGRVVAVVAERGSVVREGDVIVRLAMDDRTARLAEDEAVLVQRERDHAAAKRLGKTGYQSRSALNQAFAALQKARAAVEAVQIDIARTELRAPFDGILDARVVEVGDYVAIKDDVFTIVDNDPIVVAAELPQQDRSRIALGSTGQVRFVTGERSTGRVRYLSVSAATATRTFRIELAVPNSGWQIPAGISADISIPTDSVEAHLISPAVLNLAADGAVGVKTVAGDSTVKFYPVNIVRTEADGIWVTGLPATARIITVGQNFVRAGDKVDASVATADGGGASPDVRSGARNGARAAPIAGR